MGKGEKKNKGEGNKGEKEKGEKREETMKDAEDGKQGSG